MPNILDVRHSHPLEREYESWIVHGIEAYFESLKMEFAIWAVSPGTEAIWPADEKLITSCKVVGLQFKQAKLAKGAHGFSRLWWSLHNPAGQFALVQSMHEIFYCLPTFVDRSVRDSALEHCLFWRPNAANDSNVWYDNPAASTPYRKVCDAMRWGYFIEALLSCNIGVRANSALETRRCVERIYDRVRGSFPSRGGSDTIPERESALYVLIAGLENQS